MYLLKVNIHQQQRTLYNPHYGITQTLLCRVEKLFSIDPCLKLRIHGRPRVIENFSLLPLTILTLVTCEYFFVHIFLLWHLHIWWYLLVMKNALSMGQIILKELLLLLFWWKIEHVLLIIFMCLWECTLFKILALNYLLYN